MEKDVGEWQTVLPWSKKRKVLMKLKGTPPSGRRESLKGGSVDSDMSGKEVARALGRLSRGGMHEFVINVPPDRVEALLGYVPNMVPAPTLISLQLMPESSSSSAVGSVAIESRFLNGNQAKRVPHFNVSSTGFSVLQSTKPGLFFL